uniref:Pollen Ole e 1 allergen and extensin family protein n=1 Tax=Fagus sylvatica TaxID=28930 RepID=A0A2N9IRN6_FAGSY
MLKHFSFILVLARIEISTGHVVKGKISCHDCTHNDVLSGIKVFVKCDRVKKSATAITEDDGSFEAELPSETPKSSSPLNCHAMLLGGPTQLYALKENLVSKIIKTHEPNSYTISTPLSFSTSCSSTKESAKCKDIMNKFGSSKTINLPLPPEWGFAPSSFYIPFFPIIGIP